MNASDTTTTSAPTRAAGRELERVGDRAPGMHTGQPAYMAYSEEMRRLVGKAIMPKDYEPHELYYVLELAATYNLDPFTREIWAVRYSKNADKGAVQIVVGRDGLLAIAQRHPDYLGFRCEAFYENDETELLDVPVEWPLPSGGSVYTRYRHRAPTPSRSLTPGSPTGQQPTAEGTGCTSARSPTLRHPLRPSRSPRKAAVGS